MLTATKDLMLPATVTGLVAAAALVRRRPVGPAARHGAARRPLPRAVPRRPRTVIADQERAGLDILTNGDYHLDEDFAGRSWHHYPLQRWKGFEHEELQYDDSRDGLLAFPPGTLMNEIETTWRWPRVVGKVEHDPKNPLEYAKLWRIAQARAASGKPVKFGTCSSQVLAIFLDSHTAEYDLDDKKQLIWDMADGDEHGAAPARRRRREGHPDRGADDPFHGLLPPGADGAARFHGRRVQPRGGRARRRRAVDPHLLGQPQHAEGLHAASRTRTRSTSTSTA